MGDEDKLTLIAGQLARIADALERMAQGSAPQEPNLVRPIEEYAGFDWESIGATPVREDPDGATHVEWGGYMWTRRSPSNRFDPAIWYSRASGRDEDGEVKYLRLITFKTIKDADPIPRAGHRPVSRIAGSRPAKPAQGQLGELESSKPAKGQDAGDQVTATAYYADATGKRWNLSREAAAAVARALGVDTMNSKADFSTAYKALPYFAECKAKGLNFQGSLDILKECRMDLEKAVLLLRERHPGE